MTLATSTGRELAGLALELSDGDLATAFSRRLTPDDSDSALRVRFHYGLVIINVATLIWFLNRVLDPDKARIIINALYNTFFDRLQEEGEIVRIGDLIVDKSEQDFLFQQMPVGPDTNSDLYTISTIIYHARQGVYLKLLSESVKTRDILGPMGGIALRFFEELTGENIGPDSEGTMDLGSVSPMELSVLLVQIMTDLTQRAAVLIRPIAG